MKPGGLVAAAARSVRAVDRRLGRAASPDTRRVLVDARTAMEYAVIAPVQRELQRDPCITVYATSSERPHQLDTIYRDRDDKLVLTTPRACWASRFDTYLAADFLWATLPRGTCRVQMFHGVAGKWSQLYDRPSASMRHWDRLLFINQRRRDNFVRAGAVDADSPALCLVGMPKTDCLVDGSLQRDAVLAAHGLDPSKPSVLYAPTWTPHSSLNLMGEALVRALIAASFTVIVKLHENSRDGRHANSGGIDWVGRLSPLLGPSGYLVQSSDASPWMVAADVLITDHSSIGFEYLLRDRPVIRIEVPELLRRTQIPQEYIDLLVGASTTTRAVADTVEAASRAVIDPRVGSADRRAVAADLFYEPGRATFNAVRELRAVMNLDPSLVVAQPLVRPDAPGVHPTGEIFG